MHITFYTKQFSETTLTSWRTLRKIRLPGNLSIFTKVRGQTVLKCNMVWYTSNIFLIWSLQEFWCSLIGPDDLFWDVPQSKFTSIITVNGLFGISSLPIIDLSTFLSTYQIEHSKAFISKSNSPNITDYRQIIIHVCINYSAEEKKSHCRKMDEIFPKRRKTAINKSTLQL